MNRNTSLAYVLRALESFHKREGHSCVPAGHTEQELRLGDAVDHLRKLRADGGLPAAVRVRIQSHTGWYWGRGDSPTHRFIAAVGGFISLHGHTRFKPGSKLESIAADFRAQLDAGTLDRDTFLALQSFPQWRWETGPDRGWGDHYRKLLELTEQMGHSKVPTEQPWGQLAGWTTTQRSTHRAGALLASRSHRMEMLQGWEWQPAAGMRERYLTELLSYVEAHGSADVPKDYVTADGFALGESLNRIRRVYRRGDLPARRTADLEAVPGWEWSISTTRRKNIDKTSAAFRAFVEREGHANVPAAHIEDGVQLGANLTAARVRLKKGQMGQDMKDALDAVHVGWRKGLVASGRAGRESRGDLSLAA